MHQHLSRMTLREKVAQMVFIDFRFDDADYDRTMRLVKKEGVGGIRLFGGSIFDVPGFVNSLQRVAKFPLLVAADYKDGAGSEVSGATAFPPIVTTEELSQLKGRHTALEARALGVRCVKAPEFVSGPDPLSRAFVKGLHTVGVLACVRGRPKERGEYVGEVDALLDAGLNSEATSEIRADLDFGGLICFDLPLHSDREGVERAARSGADVLVATGDPDLAIQILEDEVKAGRLSEASVDRSVERILAAKERLGLFNDRMTDVASVETVVGGMMSRATGQRIAEAAMTLIRGTGRVEGSAALVKIHDDRAKGDLTVFETELAKRVTVSEGADRGVIAILSPTLDDAELVRIREAEGRFKETIVVLFGELTKEVDARNLVCAHGRDLFSQRAAAKALAGEIEYRGPVPK